MTFCRCLCRAHSHGCNGVHITTAPGQRHSHRLVTTRRRYAQCNSPMQPEQATETAVAALCACFRSRWRSAHASAAAAQWRDRGRERRRQPAHAPGHCRDRHVPTGVSSWIFCPPNLMKASAPSSSRNPRASQLPGKSKLSWVPQACISKDTLRTFTGVKRFGHLEYSSFTATGR